MTYKLVKRSSLDGRFPAVREYRIVGLETSATDPKATFVTVTLTSVADVVKSAWGALVI